MNDHDPRVPDELDLLRRLRQLPREREPAHDLWPSLRQRIEATTPRVASARPHHRWLGAGLALAAMLVLAAGVALHAPPSRSPSPATVEAQQPSPADLSLRHEADAVTLEYHAALDAFAATPLPPELHAAASVLDASAMQLRDALRLQPDAPYLLVRLRHTYDQRLRLTQRAVAG